MPLIKGKKAATKKGISENISREIRSGRKPDQAAAIAYSVAKEAKSKSKKRKK